MKREFLEELGLEKDVIDKIMDENGKDINREKNKLEVKDQEIDLLNNQLEEANNTIKSYKDMDIDRIKQSAEEWEDKYNEAVADIEQVKNKATLDKAIMQTNTIDPDLLMKIIDQEQLQYTDKGIIGLDEQIEEFKESKPYLFENDSLEKESLDGFQGHDPENSSGDGISAMESELDAIFDE